MLASEDQDLCVRISKLGKVVYLNDLTAYTDSRRLKKFGLIGLLFDWGRTTPQFRDRTEKPALRDSKGDLTCEAFGFPHCSS